jgi:N6-adenosine-specific RNA methylase IME4
MTYNLIIADPPWEYRQAGAKGNRSAFRGTADQHYTTTGSNRLAEMDVANRIADPKGTVLLMWATMPLLPDALHIMRCWGFQYVTAATWIKASDMDRRTIDPTDATAAYGCGFWWRGNAELILLGRCGNPPSPRALETAGDIGLVSNLLKHSAKPKHLHDWAVRNLPNLDRRAELFAREVPDADLVGEWHCYGNEVHQPGYGGHPALVEAFHDHLPPAEAKRRPRVPRPALTTNDPPVAGTLRPWEDSPLGALLA